MRILITGGAGFIGSNLVRLAVGYGHEVRVIDDLSTGYAENLEDLEVDLRIASILDDHALDAAMREVDAVIHLAALGSVPRSVADPMATHQVNALGTLNVILSARKTGVGHLSVASSSSVYGMNPALPKNEREWVRAMSPYAVTKLATEQYALAAQQSFGMSTLAFRFFNVYGPNQRAGHAYAAVIPVFLDALSKGVPLPVNGDGTQSRDFTYVDTVCSVLLRSAERGVCHPEPVNLAFGTNTSILELIAAIRSVSGREVAVEHREPRPGDVQHSQADNSTLRALYPDISPVPLADGLARTYQWFQREK